jgi:ribokinase
MKATVVVVGAVNVDLVVAAPRLPAPGETVVGPGLERHGGGKGANAAVAAARAGARVRYIGAVGQDEFGRTALAELRAEGIDVDDVIIDGDTSTGVALIVVDDAGENQIAVGAGANARLTAADVRGALARALPDVGCVLVSTEIPGDAVAAAVEAAADAGVLCVLNPAPVIPSVAELLKHGPMLTPNLGELAALSEFVNRHGRPASDAEGGWGPADPLVQARELGERTRAPVVVTLGGDGVLVVASDGQAEHLPARPTRVRDTTGAGDTFNGVLAARLAAGDTLAAASRTANIAAALAVTAVGARDGMPDTETIRAASTEA